jgi:hypothetical protein
MEVAETGVIQKVVDDRTVARAKGPSARQGAPLELVERSSMARTAPRNAFRALFVLILTANLLANETIIDEGLRAFVKIAKLIGMDFGYVGASKMTKLLGLVRLRRSVPVKGTQRRKGLPAPPHTTPPFSLTCSTSVTTGEHKKTSHFTGCNILLVIWLPKELMYKVVESIIKSGERMIYDIGQEVGITFSNTVQAFGRGLNYLLARGNEAIFSLYIAQQVENMCNDYRDGVGFLDTNIGHPSERTKSGEPYGYVVWPCPSCGGYIMNQGLAKCGNGRCNGAKRPNRNMKRYLQRQTELLRLVDDGTHTVYSCKPCARCVHQETRPVLCTQCMSVDLTE